MTLYKLNEMVTDSSLVLGQRWLCLRLCDPASVCNCFSFHSISLLDTLSDFIEKNSGCSLTGSYGLSLQIVQQMECNRHGMVQSLATFEQLCIQSSCFPFMSSDAATSLKEYVNSSLLGSFTVSEALVPLPYQYIKHLLSLKRICFESKAEIPGEGTFASGMAIQIAEAEELNRHLPLSEWEQDNSSGTNFRYKTQ